MTKHLKHLLLILLIPSTLIACNTPSPNLTPLATTVEALNTTVAQLSTAVATPATTATAPPLPTTAENTIAETTAAEATPRPTFTPLPTLTRLSTASPFPTASPTAVYTPIPITADAPECDESQHDPNQWHTLWNDQFGCHYAHEHKHNPHEVDDIFGPPGAWFGGGELSYPWQTFAGADGNFARWSGDNADLENSAKHAGYGWIVRRDIPQHGNAWIKDFRIQYHAISAPPGTLTRFHSFSLEANVCRTIDQCGLIRRGGWLDFGNLQVSRAGVVDLAGEADAVEDEARRRVHFFYDDAPLRTQANNKTEFFWYGRNRPTSPPYDNVPVAIVIALATSDAWANVDPADPQALNLFCPDYQCDKNGSTIQAHVLDLIITTDNASGYTDRYGRVVTGCTNVSLDCIPYSIENAPIERVQHRDDRDLGLFSDGSQEFDLSPPGVWWIRYPN